MQNSDYVKQKHSQIKTFHPKITIRIETQHTVKFDLYPAIFSCRCDVSKWDGGLLH